MINITIKGQLSLMYEELGWKSFSSNYEHETLPGILTKEMVGQTYTHPLDKRQKLGPTDYYIVDSENEKDKFHIYDWMIESVSEYITTLEDVDNIIKGI